MITKHTSLQEVLKLAPACDCAACRHGCKMGSGVFAKGEAQELADHKNISIEKLKEESLEEIELFNQKMLRPKLSAHPFGTCTFFDEKKGCTIHEKKPLQCKVAMGCKEYGQDLMVWFMLNSIIDPKDAQSVREYSSYLRSGGKTIPGGELESLVPDKELLSKMLSYEMLK